MVHTSIRAIVLLALIVLPGTARAQPAAAEPRWDAAGAIGVFLGHADPGGTQEGYQEDWYESIQGSVVLGRYLSRHFKMELEASTTGRGTRYSSTSIAVPGDQYPRWVFSEERTAIRSLAGAAVWQFRENEWVHPFVLAGVSVDVDDVIVYVPQQFFRSDPRDPFGTTPIAEERTTQSTTSHVRAVLGGGAKLYFRERAFVRTDGRLSWSGTRQHLAFRVGVGIDF